MEEMERIRQKKTAPLIITIVAVLLAIIILSSSLVVTSEDEFTLVKQFGKIQKVIDTAGLSFRIPFVETVTRLPKKILLYDLATSDVITKDKKTMVADSYVLWRIDDPERFVQTLNAQIASAENRINTTVYNSLKNVISSMPQTEVISGRDGALSKAIMDNIGTTMEQYGIYLISVETKHLDLPADNKAAVYERMISERNNIAASFTAEGESAAKKIRTTTDNEIAINISKADAEAEKLIAEGEAEYMKILSNAYSDESRSDFYSFVRSLDAAAYALKGGNKTLILNQNSPIAQIFNNIQ